ncbi:hypothetical protein LCGC14_1176300 [marine sediment metagenome]|uniref:Uncharacterized protein n=1 Tax=marine sediment metagenome TaxID=412755 RepID=A0A0F9LNG0_9ZZZZ
MATLTGTDRAAARQLVARAGVPVDYTKPQIDAALQALEDLFESANVKAAVSKAIDGATAPQVLMSQQKRHIFRAFLRLKFGAA